MYLNEVRVAPIRCGTVSCYLLKTGEQGVLVDTGRLGYAEHVVRACKNCAVKLIILTHGHVDHVQNTAYLARLWDVPVAIHSGDLPLLEDNQREPLIGRGVLGRLMLSATNRNFDRESIEPFTPDIFLSEGDSLKQWGIDAQVLELPGHTRGSIGLDVNHRYLIVGDALMNLGRPGPALVYSDETALLGSAAKLAALGARKVYFGHGMPARNRMWTN